MYKPRIEVCDGLYFNIVKVEDIDKVKDEVHLVPGTLMQDKSHYCLFCGEQKYFFKDEMEQVVCRPKVDHFIEAGDYTLEFRCSKCKTQKRKKTFDGREIAPLSDLKFSKSEYNKHINFVKSMDFANKSFSDFKTSFMKEAI